MIRPFTVVCMLLACGSGLYVYQTKHRALLLDRDIGHTLKLTEAARERTTALRAEWALLNEPERLAELSRQHLGLRSLVPSQFVTLADLGAKLPAPLPPERLAAPPAEEDEPASAVPVADTKLPAPVQAAIQAPVQAPVPAPIQLAARPLPRPHQADPAPYRVAQADPAPSYRAPVTATPLPAVPASAPRPQQAAPPRLAPMVTPVAMPAPRIMPVTTAATAFSSPAPHTASLIGDSVARVSALGGGRPALPPPTPYTGQ